MSSVAFAKPLCELFQALLPNLTGRWCRALGDVRFVLILGAAPWAVRGRSKVPMRHVFAMRKETQSVFGSPMPNGNGGFPTRPA